MFRVFVRRIRHNIFIFLSLLYCPSLLAATIIIPEAFDVVSVNGKTKGFTFFSSSSEIEVPTGRNVLVLRYEEVFEDDYTDVGIVISSLPFAVEFDVDKQQVIDFSPTTIASDKLAYEFVKKPKITISADGKELPVKVSWYKEQDHNNVISDSTTVKEKAAIVTEESSSSTTQLGDLELQSSEVLVTELKKERTQSTNVSQLKPSSKQQTLGQSTVENDDDSRALSMLNYWWQQASEQERKAFLINIKK